MDNVSLSLSASVLAAVRIRDWRTQFSWDSSQILMHLIKDSVSPRAAVSRRNLKIISYENTNQPSGGIGSV